MIGLPAGISGCCLIHEFEVVAVQARLDPKTTLPRSLARRARPLLLQALLPWHGDMETAGLVTITRDEVRKRFVIAASEAGLALAAEAPLAGRGGRRPAGV